MTIQEIRQMLNARIRELEYRIVADDSDGYNATALATEYTTMVKLYNEIFGSTNENEGMI